MHYGRTPMQVTPRKAWSFVHWQVVGAVVLWLGNGGQAAAHRSLEPENWDAGVRLSEAIDTNADPRIVEISLEARIARVDLGAGQSVEAWTYNGGVPGPLIRIRVGDRLIAHFTNKLPQPTTVHWHGIRLPIAMDGVPEHSQPEVRPGETFTYDFVVPDAGLFWYHPHVMSAAQVGFGLYGALLVEDPAEQAAIGVDDELVLVLSDMSIVPEGTLEAPDAGGSIGTMFGREGSHVLVNGREQSKLIARSGVPQRWRIVNTAKSRFFNLDLDGTMFRRIGGDGGLQEYTVDSESVVLAPGERADVIVTPKGAPGSEVTLRSILFYRGFGTVEGRFPYNDLFTIAFADAPAYVGPTLPEVHRDITPLSKNGATSVDLQLTVIQPADGAPEYQMSGPLFDAKRKTIQARLGETQVWTVTNKSSWSHPFHLHGFFFQVLDDSGAPVRPLAWKDTVNIPFDQTVRLIVRFDERPGSWMFHCHILDHAEGGLMGMVNVSAVAPAEAALGGTAHSHHTTK